MKKLILEIIQKNLFKTKKDEKSSQNPSRISCQSVLIPRKISGTFYVESRENFMEFEDNVEIEGNSTRNLKKKHKEFITRDIVYNTSY
jgi:hypothetical protein